MPANACHKGAPAPTRSPGAPSHAVSPAEGREGREALRPPGSQPGPVVTTPAGSEAGAGPRGGELARAAPLGGPGSPGCPSRLGRPPREGARPGLPPRPVPGRRCCAEAALGWAARGPRGTSRSAVPGPAVGGRRWVRTCPPGGRAAGLQNWLSRRSGVLGPGLPLDR